MYSCRQRQVSHSGGVFVFLISRLFIINIIPVCEHGFPLGYIWNTLYDDESDRLSRTPRESLQAVGVSCVTHCSCTHCIDKTFNQVQTKRKSTTLCCFLKEVIFHAKNDQNEESSQREFENNVSRGSRAAKTTFRDL